MHDREHGSGKKERERKKKYQRISRGRDKNIEESEENFPLL